MIRSSRYLIFKNLESASFFPNEMIHSEIIAKLILIFRFNYKNIVDKMS